VTVGTVASLFAGVGGIDLGLQAAGWETVFVSESWRPARCVLAERFPGVATDGDVRELAAIPDTDVVAAGFPCTDLSQAGSMEGIAGENSSLVRQVFRLLSSSEAEWVVLENVPNMLVLHGGAAIREIVDSLETLGYRWAYRTVDTRFTGLPQRRRRVLVVASRSRRPQDVLLADDAGPRSADDFDDRAYGFYWTEGRGGLGWVRDAIPTLKGGSTIGLPSAPAVYLPGRPQGRRIVMPVIADGERLQGFPAGWTAAAARSGERDHRWKLVGNAVPVPVARWLGRRLADPGDHHDERHGGRLDRQGRWPAAAWGGSDGAWVSAVSEWPVHESYVHLRDLLDADAATPLSHRAATGFRSRLEASGRSVDEAFRRDLTIHISERLVAEQIPA